MVVGEIIPENKEGVSTDTETELEFKTEEEAANFYSIVKQRLTNVNGWHELAGAATARFQLTDEHGNEVNRTVHPGDHFKISVPAPGTVAGDGYDCVHVEAVEEDKNVTAIRVRPCPNPQTSKNEVAHFFNEAATSSFIVRREGTKVTAAVHGRNEKPNTDSETFTDKLRNAAVAIGAISGFSKLQWKSLVNGLMS